ncbi:unnamed protein product [Adineta steineri]|uniref:Uncharacterized protein n=1 Tax=Adineta steineri TaxID=433720 RepID=A0A818ZSW8_9BILA|nr:unnamed protein product [Adineta steineri]CAF3773339.1 unnamed protein product [Adineta steineri]
MSFICQFIQLGGPQIRFVWLSLFFIVLGSVFVLYQTQPFYITILPPLINHLYPTDFPSLYKNLVLLSCSSDSYTSIYCYYLPFTALAWRRIGFEPIIFLVGSSEKFAKMPLINFLKNDLKIEYHIINVDSSRSISLSQMIRLFGGFLSYDFNTTKDYFIMTSDADLLPITRSRYEIARNHTNYILAVNAYCCPSEKFSYGDFHDIHYYPISYIGMEQDLWKKLFLPLNNCSVSSNITVDMIECCLKEKMNVSLPKNVIKGTKQWDIDQRFISLLVAQAERFYGTYVDKRSRGSRLDPNKEFLSSDFNSILDYHDVHLPNQHENIIYSNRTWLVLKNAFSYLFNNDTIELLSRYHYETVASVFTQRKL